MELVSVSKLSLSLSGDRNWLNLLGPTEEVPHEDAYRIQCPKRSVLNKRQEGA
jgi:hypothetical protein